MNKKEQIHYDLFEDRRKKLGLKPGQRWLTTDDVWQLGDEYEAGSGWWKIGGPHTSIRPGTPVSHCSICYTPRGKR